MILIANHEGTIGVSKSIELMKQNIDGLRAIIEGIKIVEKDTSIHSVGKGGWPNILGDVELDACVMNGDNLRTGAVGSLMKFLHPVEIAYQIMERLDHEILVGPGAGRFAKEIGAETSRNLTEDAKRVWYKCLNEVLTEHQRRSFPEISLVQLDTQAIDPEKIFDTTVYMSKDNNDKMSVATSTSGWAWKYPGRLGDSPIIGAGAYADSRYGTCACTHTGEMTIRACTARSVILYMKMGKSVEDAIYEAVEDLKGLKTGYLNEVTIHAIDKNEKYKVVSYKGSVPVKYWVWTDGMDEPRLETAEYID